ncbi:MAG: hypothetical protein WAV18_09945, partial [Roseiarcus sp.]
RWVAGFKSESWPASDRNRWPASYWNAWPASSESARIWGLALGAMVLIAAIATLTWRREYEHLPPGVALVALTGIELALVLVD